MEEWRRRERATLVCFLLAGLFCESFVTLVMSRSLEESFAEQKNYYSPDPHTPSTPPKHKDCRKKPECTCSPTPSHGGSGHTQPSHGGGTSGSYGTPPPSHGGGGYYTAPPLVPSPPPSSVDPGTPTTPYVTPTTPYYVTPVAPTTPTIITPPAPPLIPNPNIPPFFIGPLNYWQTHPTVIWGLCGYWVTIGSLFGLPATTPFGSSLTVLEALANSRADGMGELFRQGTASFLNSMVNNKFPFTTQQVKDAFNAAVVSNKAAGIQAGLFKTANEGHLKH